jgi:hypothetical protein
MIGPVSRVSNLPSAALVRFDRAAGEVVRAAQQASPPATAPDVVGATAEMMSERFAFSAALAAARVSNDMLSQAIQLGGYSEAR